MAIDYTNYVDPAMRRAQAKTTQPSVQDVLDEDAYYYKKVGDTGLTQAQLEARANAAAVAAKTGGTVDPITGMITPKQANTVKDTTPTGDTSLLKSQAQLDAEAAAAEKLAQRQSAYDLLYSQFKQYGLESLVEPLKGLIQTGASPSEFTIKLRDTDQYKKRFAANQARIQKGLTALNEAEYLGMEDAYQSLMRQYGLPASYYTKGDLGRQEGFEKLIANDVSATELEDRIATAQQRVLNTNPEVLQALRSFYPDLSNADILAYTLNPEQGLADIKRKVTAAEIGGAALAQGLQAGQASAEALAGYGVTKEQAQQGYQNVAEILPRGSQLASIYGQSPYTQAVAEAEVFGTAGATEAKTKRKKLAALEEASFGGSSGVGALGRERPSAYSATQTYGAGQY